MAQADGGAEGRASIQWGTRCFNEAFKSGNTCSWDFLGTENVSQGMMKSGTEKELFFSVWVDPFGGRGRKMFR